MLILDGLADQNAGTLLRSALASGIRTVLTHKTRSICSRPRWLEVEWEPISG